MPLAGIGVLEELHAVHNKPPQKTSTLSGPEGCNEVGSAELSRSCHTQAASSDCTGRDETSEG